MGKICSNTKNLKPTFKDVITEYDFADVSDVLAVFTVIFYRMNFS